MRIAVLSVIKHLMTGPKGNSEFCFPETLNVPRGEAEGNIEVEGKQNSLFPEGAVIKCFVILPDFIVEKRNCENMISLSICIRWLTSQTSGSQNRAVVPKRHDNNLFLRS